jgi:predicted RNA binding protein with dsRBD fold (UPF0201 family)
MRLVKRSKKVRERIKEAAEIKKLLDGAETVIETVLYPCEDRDRVVTSLMNVFPDSVVERDLGDGYKILVIRKKGPEPILKIFNHFRQRRVLATVRKILRKYLDSGGNELTLFLHKQAAYAGTLSICEPGESPLGEIIVRIRVRDANRVIKWFTAF